MFKIDFLKEKLSELHNPHIDMEVWYKAVAHAIPNEGSFLLFANIERLSQKTNGVQIAKIFGTNEENKATAKKLLEEHIKLLEVESNNSSINHTFHNISNANIQINTHHSQQTLNIQQHKNDLLELMNILKEDIKNMTLPSTIQDDLEAEISYVERNIRKGNRVDTALTNIGGIIKSVGSNVFANLIASPIFEITKPLLGL